MVFEKFDVNDIRDCTLTVNQLIDKLNNIKDKTARVYFSNEEKVYNWIQDVEIDEARPMNNAVVLLNKKKNFYAIKSADNNFYMSGFELNNDRCKIDFTSNFINAFKFKSQQDALNILQHLNLYQNLCLYIGRDQ